MKTLVELDNVTKVYDAASPQPALNGISLRIIESWNRHAPGTLARNAPIGPAPYRRLDSILAPIRNPFDVFNRR